MLIMKRAITSLRNWLSKPVPDDDKPTLKTYLLAVHIAKTTESTGRG